VKYLIIAFIKAWRAIVSPWYGQVCRYYPSCSTYGLEAVRLHGAVRGSWLTIKRLLRCNPWSLGGVDPVPGSALEAQIAAEEAMEPQAVDRLETVTEQHRPAVGVPVQTSMAGWFHHATNEVCPC